MANLITSARLALLYVVIYFAYQPIGWWQMANVALLIIVFVSDGLDGWVARKRNETSVFGAMFDIAADRIVELSLWVAYLPLGLVPLWAPLIFILRGSLVDAIRARQTGAGGGTPFDMMQGRVAKFLVAGRFMRGFYAAMKGILFCWLLLIFPLPELIPQIWAQWGWLLSLIGDFLIWTVVGLCIVRGLPVILEFAAEQGLVNKPDNKPG